MDASIETTAPLGVQVRREGRAGRITLDRPKALNALDWPMIRAIAASLRDWAQDDRVEFVLLDAAPGRAFCAGGDIRAVRRMAIEGEHDAIRAFFADEYGMNLAIARFPKPYVVLVDGLALGGGLGVSVHGSDVVATERAVFGMPETAIGFFPDIGASFFLPRLPDRVGRLMGLLGERVSGPDAVAIGLARHFVPADRLPGLAEALVERGIAALAEFAEAPPEGPLQAHRRRIARAFEGGSVLEIRDRLAADEAPEARNWAARLGQMSPTGLRLAFAAEARGASMPLEDVLAMELRLTAGVTRHPDFAEGVRAAVVDKDRNPRWQRARLEDVTDAEIEALFDGRWPA